VDEAIRSMKRSKEPSPANIIKKEIETMEHFETETLTNY
jgi:hypothetical protein